MVNNSSATVHSASVEPLWTVEQVSAYLGVPVATLYQWRYRRTGPRAARVGPTPSVRPGRRADVGHRPGGLTWLFTISGT
jgi:hypothetical protein